MNNIAQLLAASKGGAPMMPPGMSPAPSEPTTVNPGARLALAPEDAGNPPDAAAGAPVTINVKITATQDEIQGAVAALQKAGMGNIAEMLQKAASPASAQEKDVNNLQSEIVAQGNNPHSGMVMP